MVRPLPSLRQLRYLAALAEHRHFGRAAESCAVTQSTLSAGLKELESHLGVVLVERTKRHVMLTPLGEAVVGRAEGLLRGAEDLVDMVRAAGRPLTGPLRLGVIPTIAPFLLPRLSQPLRRTFPDLKVYWREDLTARLIEGLSAGQMDAAILALPYAAEGLSFAEIAEDPFLVAFAPAHPFAGRDRIPVESLSGQTLLLLEDGHCLREHALAACGLAASGPGDEVRGTSLQTVAQMVASGLGVTLLPRLAVESGLAAAAGIEVRPLSGDRPPRRLALAWRKSSPRGEEFRRLAAFIGGHLS